ncbi:MAG: class I SAM-dependent methyltransferase [Candidatus Sericytochromatia bacterium]
MEDLQLSGVPGTSLWGLRARAEEQQRADALFADPLALAWHTRLLPFFSPALEAGYSPVLQQAIALRTAVFDETVQKHLTRFPTGLVVELGAGFSTRFSRLQPEQAEWVELDLPELIELRLALREAPHPHHHCLADSLFAPEWHALLPQVAPEEILFLAEGLLMFFPVGRVEQLFDQLSQRFPGALIAFDVMGRWNLRAAQNACDEVDAPMYWGQAHLDQTCARFGLLPREDLALPAQLRAHPAWARRLRPLQRWLLQQRWLTARLGGTVLGQFPA